MEAVAAAVEPRPHSRGWVVAPSYTLGEKVFREILAVFLGQLSIYLISYKERDHYLQVRNIAGGISEITVRSAESPSSLLGEALDWVIIDEASRLKAAIWQSYLSQRLIDRQGWALIISTPCGRGWLYEAFVRGQGQDKDYESWNAPSWENKYLDVNVIEAERSRIPEAVFAQEYGGEFLNEAGLVFHNVQALATGDWQPPLPGKHYVAGVDLARYQDYTVVVLMNMNREVVHVDRFRKVPWDSQSARIRALCARYNHAQILCDSTGVGDPFVEGLQRAGCKVEGYKLLHGTKQDLISNLQIMMEEKRIKLPRVQLWPEGIAELENFEYYTSEARNILMSAPSGQHDDCVVALALAAWQVRRRPGKALTVFSCSSAAEFRAKMRALRERGAQG